MATTGKTQGFPFVLSVGDSAGVSRDLSNDINSFNLSTNGQTWDVTGLDKSAIERLILLKDIKLTLKGAYNPGANKSHIVFTGLLQSGSTGTNGGSTCLLNLPKQATGDPVLSFVALWTDYNLTRGPDGKFEWDATGQLADGTVPTWTSHA